MSRLRKAVMGCRAVVTAGALLVLTASSSFAAYPTYGWYYYISNSPNYVHCGWAEGGLYTQPGDNGGADFGTRTLAKQAVYCLSQFALPAGWIGTTAVLQYWDGSTWQTYWNSGNITNVSGDYIAEAHVYDDNLADSWCWRGVGGHTVLMDGGFQQTIGVTANACNPN